MSEKKKCSRCGDKGTEGEGRWVWTCPKCHAVPAPDDPRAEAMTPPTPAQGEESQWLRCRATRVPPYNVNERIAHQCRLRAGHTSDHAFDAMPSSAPREPQKDETLDKCVEVRNSYQAAWRRIGSLLVAAGFEDDTTEGAVTSALEELTRLREVPREPHAALLAEQKCDGCSGAYRFDTSVPSVLWNRVIRVHGERPELFCIACIVREFAKAGESFTAELFGDGFSALPIEVTVNGQAAKDAALIQAENNELRHKIATLEVGRAVHSEDWRLARDPEGCCQLSSTDGTATLVADVDRALVTAQAGIVQWRKMRVNYERLLHRCRAALAPVDPPDLKGKA